MKQISYPTILEGLWFGDVYIHEPGGLLTNGIMAIFCGWYFWKTRNCTTDFARYWRFFLLFLGLGTLGGCFTHGFPTYLGEVWFYRFWFVKNAFVPVVNCFSLLGLAAAFDRSDTKWIKGGLIIKTIAAVVALGLTLSFTPVAIDLGVSYILLVIFSAIAMKTQASMKLIFYAFVCTILSGFFYVVKYDVDPLWLTHKDIVHVFALISIWLIQKAIRTYSIEQAVSPKEV